jgi:hypothetical protein
MENHSPMTHVLLNLGRTIMVWQEKEATRLMLMAIWRESNVFNDLTFVHV